MREIFLFFIFNVFKKTNVRPLTCSFLKYKTDKIDQTQIKIRIFIILNIVGTFRISDEE